MDESESDSPDGPVREETHSGDPGSGVGAEFRSDFRTTDKIYREVLIGAMQCSWK